MFHFNCIIWVNSRLGKKKKKNAHHSWQFVMLCTYIQPSKHPLGNFHESFVRSLPHYCCQTKPSARVALQVFQTLYRPVSAELDYILLEWKNISIWVVTGSTNKQPATKKLYKTYKNPQMSKGTFHHVSTSCAYPLASLHCALQVWKPQSKELWATSAASQMNRIAD